MLQLKRKTGQQIIIEGDIKLTVISTSNTTVNLGFEFADGRKIYRKEVFDRINQDERYD